MAHGTPPPAIFLSSNTQDFIEVCGIPSFKDFLITEFLSSNTQDFIEVRGCSLVGGCSRYS